jgi:hypothetical protein
MCAQNWQCVPPYMYMYHMYARAKIKKKIWPRPLVRKDQDPLGMQADTFILFLELAGIH